MSPTPPVQAPGKRAVLLVDHRQRDLPVAALIAHQLQARGVECLLEPIEAWRGVIAAHRPDLILFNHVLASHLVACTRRLQSMGVLTGVILNEGLCYNDEVRAHNAQRNHRAAHLDLFFCWNTLLKEALEKTGMPGSSVHVVGNPRHDFFFPPWSGLHLPTPNAPGSLPQVLLCTNFGFADFHDLPQAETDKFFAPWKDRISTYRDYMGMVGAHHRARLKAREHLRALLECGRYHVTLRPHPRENPGTYHRWAAELPESLRARLTLDTTSHITSLLLACDLAIGCENCNTVLEAWIAGKPTLELVFEKHPVFYSEAVGRLNPECADPATLPGLVDNHLRPGAQDDWAEARRRHLETWCAGPQGRATEQIADHIARALSNRPPPDWSRLALGDYRRAAKLHLLRWLDQPYAYHPLARIKAWLSKRHHLKWKALQKAIRPSDVRHARQQLEGCA